MKHGVLNILLFSLLLLLVSCKQDIPMVNLGIDETYAVERMKKLILHPEYEGKTYRWTLPMTENADSVLSTERNFIFCKADTGVYYLHLQIVDDKNPVEQDIVIHVWDEQVAYSPYISTVYEYCPAPGQFVNKMPEYKDGDTEMVMIKKVEECIFGSHNTLITLGAYGGYVTFGFDHSVVNVANKYDFKILGNAFYSTLPEAKKIGGSCEPGIVMVACDCNQNGKADDIWYELAGSEYYKVTTIHRYGITYKRPVATHVATPRPNSPMLDTTYIEWTDNLGNIGYVVQNIYYQQDYFPKWLHNDELSFTGTLLPNNSEGKNGSWILYAYDWGYVDNHPNDSTHQVSFDIDWAVDADGNKVNLSCIDFVRVYTGVNQSCEWIGETSTEIAGAEDLHITTTKK